jgi:probable HAF family extracellular repeat protein
MPRVCSVIIGLVVCTADVQASPVITNLGVLPGATISRASAISGDGSAVAGGCYFPDGHERAFRWTASEGMRDLGVLPGCTASYGLGINDDGLTVVGDSAAVVGDSRAFRWSAATGMQELGALPGATWVSACGVSGDGSSVVGYCFTSDGPTRGFLWTSGGGMIDIGAWPGGYDSFASAISADGSTVVGSATDAEGGGGGFRWTAGGGMEDIGSLSQGPLRFSAGSAVSHDGSVVAGMSYLADGDSSACPRAVRWTAAGGMQNLGVLSGTTGSWADAISGDGSVVAGPCVGDDWSPRRAFIWTAETGMVDLNNRLASLGVDMTGWTLTDVRGLSADGSSLTGWGVFNGEERAWLVTALPEPASLALLAIGLLCRARATRKQCELRRGSSASNRR